MTFVNENERKRDLNDEVGGKFVITLKYQITVPQVIRVPQDREPKIN